MVAHRPTPKTLEEIPGDVKARMINVRAGAFSLGGFVALAFGDLSSDLLVHAPDVLLAFFATLLVLAGFFLARTFAALRNCEDRYPLLSDDDKGCSYPKARDAYASFPKDKSADETIKVDDRDVTGHAVFLGDEYSIATGGYGLSAFLIATTALVFVGAVWWSAIVG